MIGNLESDDDPATRHSELAEIMKPVTLDPADCELLRRHIEQIVEKHNIDWDEEEIDSLEAEANIGEGWFRSPIIEDELAYLIALHEIAHLVRRLPTEDEDGRVVFGKELAAWEWALKTARIQPSEEARDLVRAFFGSHADHDNQPSQEERRELEAMVPRGGDTLMKWREPLMP